MTDEDKQFISEALAFAKKHNAIVITQWIGYAYLTIGNDGLQVSSFPFAEYDTIDHEETNHVKEVMGLE